MPTRLKIAFFLYALLAATSFVLLSEPRLRAAVLVLFLGLATKSWIAERQSPTDRLGNGKGNPQE